MITERALRRACLAGQVDEGERFQTKVFLLGWCSVYRCVAYAKQAYIGYKIEKNEKHSK